MLKRLAAIVMALAIAVPAAAFAQGKPSQDQVKAITEKAAALVASDGIDKARSVFHADGEYKFGEVYVNIIDMNGVWLVYPPKPAGEGKSVLNVQDADGKFLVQDIIKVAKDQGAGWVEYRWQNPVSGKIEPKITYVKRVPGKDLIAYVGIYK